MGTNLRFKFRPNSLSMLAKGTVAAAAMCLLVPISFAQAVPYTDQRDPKTESTVITIGDALSAAGQDDAQIVKPNSSGDGVISTNVQGATVEIPKEGNVASAVLDGGPDGLKVSLGLPTRGNAEDAKVAADGTTVFNDPDRLVDVAIQTLDDGAVRTLTVINNSDAPSEYDYDIAVPDGVVLTSERDGSVSFKGTDGKTEGMILPAWAVDAKGNPVSTRYEIKGRTVTQVVEHKAEGVTYPVVADPKVYYAWWQLFTWSEWRWNRDYGMNQLSMELSAWGRHDVIFNAGQFVTSGWNLLKQKHAAWIFTESMRQQWECHVLGGIAEWGTFDLEYERGSNPNWRSRIGMWPPSATCNW